LSVDAIDEDADVTILLDDTGPAFLIEILCRGRLVFNVFLEDLNFSMGTLLQRAMPLLYLDWACFVVAMHT
jgi:hypothetical protein